MRVVTAMVGEVETQLWRDGPSYQLPQDSYYKSVERYITDLANGRLAQKSELAAVVARNLVDDVLGGVSGQTWRGGSAGTAKALLAVLPSRMLVCLPFILAFAMLELTLW